MSHQEYARAPGIGAVGRVELSNFNTRAVKVVPGLLTPASLHREVGDDAFMDRDITRSVVKGISRAPFGIGEMVLDHTVPFTVEAQIPFENPAGERLYWNVIGRNAPERLPQSQTVEAQRQLIASVAADPDYAPQTVTSLKAFVAAHNPGLAYGFSRVTPDNFAGLEAGLRRLYGEAFKNYPYDVVSAIGQSCADNLFVVADNGRGDVYSVTGAEYLPMGQGVTVAEIGDTASRPGVAGLGPLLKRVLFQMMIEQGSVPDLAFTDSRLDGNGSVIKANRRGGLQLNPDIILPGHTTIASARNHGAEMKQRSADGVEFPVENMTMTHLTRQGIYNVISAYGTAY